MMKRILFFIENLKAGGKERRLTELLIYLKQNTSFDLLLVLMDENIHYTIINELGVPIIFIRRKIVKKDPTVFYRFFKVVKDFNPDIIHCWGIMSTFYSIPSHLLFSNLLLSNLVTNTKRDYGNFSLTNIFFKMNCHFSDFVIGNSETGLNEYKIPIEKRKLFYNGVRLERFHLSSDAEQKAKLNLNSLLIVIMVASVNRNKDYDFFLDIAKLFLMKNIDVLFLGIGGGSELERIQNRIAKESISNVKMLGIQKDVEKYISISDIGVLFSPSEGISNSIIEYMASGKPVITTDINGGSKELIEHNNSGYILRRDLNLVKTKLENLLVDKRLRERFGERGRKIIEEKFSIERMGHEYEMLYLEN